MRIYVRLQPLHRPIPIDVEPNIIIADLCEWLGVQALYLPAANKGALTCIPGKASEGGPEPLDRGANLSALVQPYATLTTGTWFHWRKYQRSEPQPQHPSAGLPPNAAVLLSRHNKGLGKQTEAGLDAHHKNSACGPLHPPSISAVQPPSAPAPVLIEEEPFLVLDDDWQDLSVMVEVDDATASSASGAWTLAAEVVSGAVIAEDLTGAIHSSDEEDYHVLDLDEPELPELSIGFEASQFVVNAHQAWSDANSDVLDSLVYAWGDNSAGQCLVGDSRSKITAPERVDPRCIPVSVCCGKRCSILVSEQGTLWGGGYNTRGLLAETAITGPIRSPTRIDLAELESSQLSAVSASQEHILAVGSSGSLLAWASSNQHGQAGVGSEHALETPVFPRVPSWPSQLHRHPVRVAAVSCGDEHSLVLTDNGVVFAFGSNAAGQLGLGSAVKTATSPSALIGKARGLPFRAIAAGARHSLGLTLAGAVFAWGDNGHGALGLGTSKSSQTTVCVPTPTQPLPGPARRIAAGGRHSAVVVRKGRLLLAGDNSCGQLGHRCTEMSISSSFAELPRPHCTDLCVRAVTLGHEHTLMLTYRGRLVVCGRNTEGQCGVGHQFGSNSSEDYVEVPTEVALPILSTSSDHQLMVWAIAAGHSHNMVLCSALPEVQEFSPSARRSVTSYGCIVPSQTPKHRPSSGHDTLRGRSQQRRPTRALTGGRRRSLRSLKSFGKEDSTPGPSPSPTPSARSRGDVDDGRAMVAAMSWTPGVTKKLLREASTDGQVPLPKEGPFDRQVSDAPGALPHLLRPIVHPGVCSHPFATLSVQVLGALSTSEANGNLLESDLGRMLLDGLATPSVLNASFCFPGLRSIRLDAAGLCRHLAQLCARGDDVCQQLLDAAAEGLQTLANGPMEDLTHGDQLRALAVYLILPANRGAQGSGTRHRPLLASIAHLVARMSGAGRTALRDLLADECGDVRVLRDFLVPHVRSLAEDTIRTLGQQQWLAGQLWEVVAQLQLQRPLWEAVLLLQVLASASEQAARLLEVDVRGVDDIATLNSNGGGPLPQNVASSLPVTVGGRASAGLLDPTAFQLLSLAEGYIPPEVDFWLFQEHALFHQMTPTEVVCEPWWSDAAGMLPRRFCSFMSHANLVPTAFKQRVLQVENVLRQRLSQEQVMWPRVESVLGGGRTDLSALYFILSVSRQNLLRDTFAQMYFASPVDLRRPLRVEFTGEEAVDEGGVMREFFRLLARELFAPDAGLFYEAEGSRRLWFCPVLGAGRQLEDYWMVGVIVALAVYNNHPGLDLPLPTALFKKLKEQQTSAEDLIQLFPSHARSLEAILSWKPSKPVDSETTLHEADREFADTFCLTFCWSSPSAQGTTPEETPLCENGATRPVLYRDRVEFVSLAHEYLLHGSVQAQFESFARGFRRVCNSPLFDVLSPDELEAIVAGDNDLDFARLRQGVQYEGFSPDDPYIESLWTVLEGFSVQRRRRFLAFCTGSDVAPTGGLQELHLLVQKNGEEPTMRLPVAHTCFNLLLLPIYGSVEKLRTMLVTAIEW
eukprot:CAMPEP_0178377562 /NCGR_PEP_ID=MMETSP0689_2-20121128/3982_1 /TAXON_ID=160604 /ORGANISM="Amphidinium massartii, Strain CS-259" /LENGTH=1542 /DNA_ID=CAMNT_0019997619 /DNA_START=13 /DNA_END=4638 /DNA_ORIENTATION=+